MMNAPRLTSRLAVTALLALTALAGSLVFLGAPAGASELALLESFGSATSTVPDPYPLSDPTGVAVNQRTGDIYIADTANHRVQELSATGQFIRMFGLKVNLTQKGRGPEKENVCPVEPGDTCQPGSYRSEPEFPSMLVNPTSVAVNSTSGAVYVLDAKASASENTAHTVSKFNETGDFVCHLPLSSQVTAACPGPPDPNEPGAMGALAVGPDGTVYVGMEVSSAARQEGFVEEFDEAGGFLRGFSTGTVAVGSQTVNFEIHPSGMAVSGDGKSIYLVWEATATAVKGRSQIGRFNAVSGEREAAGTLPATLETSAITVDPTTGDVYAEESVAYEEGPTGVVAYEPSGHPLGCTVAQKPECILFAQGILPVGHLLEQSGTGLAVSSSGAAEGVFYFSDPERGRVDVFGMAKLRPVVSVLAPSFLAPSSVILRGLVNPEESPTVYRFVYGPTEAYGRSAPVAGSEAGAGGQLVVVSQSVAGLRPGTTYHYAVLASNGAGVSQSADQTFTTPAGAAPLVETGGVSGVSQSAAIVSGSVDAEGVPTTYEVDLGVDTDYGTRVFGEVGDGMQGELVSVGVQGLAPGTTYHYRLIATNIYGTSYGADQVFTTPVVATALILAPGAPPLIAVPAVAFPPEAVAANVAMPRALTGAQKLARALKACGRRARKQRAACKRQARRRYAAKGRSGRVTAGARAGRGSR